MLNAIDDDKEAFKKVKPRVLLISSFRWITVARAAIAFHEAGFSVSTLVPKGHAVEKLSIAASTHVFNIFSAEQSLIEAVSGSKPVLLVPFDDVVVPILHDVYYRRGAHDKLSILIANSLGDPAFFPVVRSRKEFAKRLSALSIASPPTLSVESTDDLMTAARTLGLPTVLKSDGSWGGQGVAIVHEQTGLRDAFARLSSRHNVLRALKRFIINRDLTPFHTMLRRRAISIVAQQYLPGRPANAAVACWKGEVLGSITLEVIQSAGETGPATVVRHIDCPDMTNAIHRIVHDLQLSGICGVDFILSGPENKPLMIELNPRSVPTVHLSNSRGQRLCHLLFEKITGRVVSPSLHAPQCDIIALFPQEMLRDPNSPHLINGFHDIPTHWPEYVALATGETTSQSYIQPDILGKI
jgi:Carbamoyl-phosphate synthase L chain, ATP binding domain